MHPGHASLAFTNQPRSDGHTSYPPTWAHLHSSQLSVLVHPLCARCYTPSFPAFTQPCPFRASDVPFTNRNKAQTKSVVMKHVFLTASCDQDVRKPVPYRLSMWCYYEVASFLPGKGMGGSVFWAPRSGGSGTTGEVAPI